MAVTHPSDGHRRFVHLFNSGDLEGIVGLYEEMAKLVVPEGELVGKDAIRTALGRFVSMGGTMHMETTSLIEGDGIAVTAGTWRLVADNGSTIVQGESVEVWRRQPDGTWLMAIDCPFGAA